MDSAAIIATEGRAALMTIVLVAGPLLGTVMIVGIVISIAQAATQISEATLSFMPKFLGAIVVLGVTGAWMLRQVETLFVTVLQAPLGR